MRGHDRHLEEPELTERDREAAEAARITRFEDEADSRRKGES